MFLKNFKQNSYGFLDTDGLDDDSIHLLDFGIESRENEPYYFDNSIRKYYVGYLFQYTIEGSGIIEINDNKYEISKERGFIIDFPSQTKYYLKKDKPWTFLYIHFSGGVLKKYYTLLKKQNNGVLNWGINSPSIQSFFSEYKRVQDGYIYKKYQASQFVFNFITQLLIDLEQPNNNTDTIERAVNFIDMNYNNPGVINDLVNKLEVTLPHISREFKKKKSINMVHYLTQTRIKKSLYLLLNTNKNINTIAKECGFSTGNYYAKVFKKYLYMTPSEYRS